jgi:hypothetical protein
VSELPELLLLLVWEMKNFSKVERNHSGPFVHRNARERKEKK